MLLRFASWDATSRQTDTDTQPPLNRPRIHSAKREHYTHWPRGALTRVMDEDVSVQPRVLQSCRPPS